MILVLTCSEDATADYLCGRMLQNAIRFIRVDTDTYLDRLQVSFNANGPILSWEGISFAPNDFSHVWLRRPKPLIYHVPDRAESIQIAHEWSECAEGFLAHIPLGRWLNHPSRNSTASHKLEQLSRAHGVGLHVPSTIVTQKREELLSFWEQSSGKVIVKPIAGGYLERDAPEMDTQVFTNRVSMADLHDLDSLASCPTLFQECIDKVWDVRITVVDNEFTAVGIQAYENGRQRVDIRRNNMMDVEYSRIDLPNEVRSSLSTMMAGYELRFAAIDMAIDSEGKWWFFEVNPNGQWAWLDLAGITDIYKSFLLAFRDQF